MKKLFRTGWLPLGACLLLVVTAGCTARMKESYHLRRGDHYYTAGQFDRAEIEYLNVARGNPENFTAISRLGEIYYAQGRIQTASQFLYRAHQLNSNDVAVCSSLSQLYQAAGKLKEARQQAAFVLDRQPENTDAPVTLAESCNTPEEIAAARSLLNRLPSSASQPALQVALGILAVKEKDLKSAAADFQRAQTLDPKSAVAWSALGFLYQAQNDLKQAEIAVKTAADLAPARSNLRMNYASFEVQTGHPDVADDYLAGVLSNTPDFVPAWIMRAEIAVSTKRYDDCDTFLEQVRAMDPDNYDAALLTGQADLVRGDTAKAQMELDRLAHKYDQIPRVHYLLAMACVANHDVGTALIQLNRALDLDPAFTEAGMMLAQLQISSGTPDPAVSLLRQILQRQPKFDQARLLLADAYRAQNHLDDALAIYQDMEKSMPTNAGLPYLEGLTSLQKPDNAAARQEFARALALAPLDLRVLEAMVRLDITEKKYDEALRILEKAMAGGAQKYPLYLLEAQVQEARGQSAETVSAFQSAIALDPGLSAAHLELAQHYVKDNQPQKALDELQIVLQKTNSIGAAWMLKGEILNGQKQYQASADAYEQMLALDPQSSVALNNLAYLYSEYLNQPDKAYEFAKKARNLLPADPSTADTLGWVLYHRGDYAGAQSLLAESVQKLSRSADVQYHYGRVSYMLGQESTAAAALKRALQLNPAFEGHEDCQRCLDVLALDTANVPVSAQSMLEKRVVDVPNDLVALNRLAALYRQLGETTQAVSVEESILKLNPDNQRTMVDLARLYAATDPAKALDMAQKAHAAAPQDPDISGLLGRLVYQSGDYKLARSLLNDSAQAKPNDAAMQVDYARAAYAMGDVANARAALQTAVKLGLPSAQTVEVNQWLDLMAAVDQPSQTQASADRAATALQADSRNVPALMVSAAVSEQKSGPAAAAPTYEKILAIYPDFAPAQKKLALIYARDPKRLDDAYRYALKARQAYPDDGDLTLAIGLILCQQGNYQEAANYLTLSQPSRPNDADLFYHLGLAQFQLKLSNESRISLKRALELNLAGQSAVDAQRMLKELK